MALPGMRIQNKERLKKQKFSALAPGIKNKFQLRNSINRRAEGLIRPKLAAVNQSGLQENQAHGQRTRDLSSYYEDYGSKLTDAYQKAQVALNQVLATNASTDTAAQQSMLAALERSHSADLAQASAVGGVLPQGIGDDVAVESQGAGAASLASLSNIQQQNALTAANQIGVGGLARTGALSHETSEHAANMQKLGKERRDILKEIPTAKEESRKDILNEELARASEREREKIARGSLHLEKRKTGEEKRSNEANEDIAREQNKISWAGIEADKEKYQQEVAKAGNAAEKEAAEAQGEQYNRGIEIFQNYFDKVKPKAYDPQSLFRNLTLAVSPQMALTIMRHGPPRFQNFTPKGKRPKPTGPSGPTTNGNYP